MADLHKFSKAQENGNKSHIHEIQIRKIYSLRLIEHHQIKMEVHSQHTVNITKILYNILLHTDLCIANWEFYMVRLKVILKVQFSF